LWRRRERDNFKFFFSWITLPKSEEKYKET
jgi:hypothetical protein